MNAINITIKITSLTIVLAAALHAEDCPCGPGLDYVGTTACGDPTCNEQLVNEYPYFTACGVGTCYEYQDGVYPYRTACGVDTCDERLHGKYPFSDACGKGVCDVSPNERCCGGVVYKENGFCCVGNKILPEKPETPTAEKPDSSSNDFPVGNISIDSASDGTWSKVGNLWYEYKYYIPGSRLTDAYAVYKQSWEQVGSPVYSKGCGNATEDKEVIDTAPPGLGQTLDAIISISGSFGDVGAGVSSLLSKVRGIVPDAKPKKVTLKLNGKRNKVFAIAAFKNKAYLSSGTSDGIVKLEIHKYKESVLDPNLIGLPLRDQMETHYGSAGDVSFAKVFMGVDMIQGPEGEGNECCMSSDV